MSEKKIATAIDILINVDRFEHVQITKYAEKKIDYETEEERIAAEDALTAEVVEDGIRSLKIVSDTFGGKTVEPTQAIMEKIRKKVPTWLEEGPVPNLAEDKYKKGVAENEAKQEENKVEREARSDEMSDVLGESEEGNVTEEPITDPLDADDDNDMLDDIVDEPANDPKEVDPPEENAEEKPPEEKAEEKPEEKPAEQSPSADDDDIFGDDDDDLFA
jgi:hypothetical protein